MEVSFDRERGRFVRPLQVLRGPFDVLDVHAAHGYLIHSFLSPIANRRDDEYGGDRDGRMRFALEIASTVRALAATFLPRGRFGRTSTRWRRPATRRLSRSENPLICVF
ncbi:hypothetical protein J8I87_27100 [Paraburkholderia sp. LEh10]|nr:hypothetical protein [Paraburkholderia sp. LEh10]